MSVGIFRARPERGFHLARTLRARGFAVTTYHTEGWAGSPDVELGGRAVRDLLRLLARTDHDVYFTSLSFVPSLSLWLNRLVRRRPYVFNFTGAKWEMFRDRARGRPARRFLERRGYPFLLARILGGASRIVTNSVFLERATAARYPQHRPRLLTVYNGIDAGRYADGSPVDLPGIGEYDAVLLAVTSLDYDRKSQGLELTLEAFARIRSADPAVRLVVAAKTSSARYRVTAERLVAGSEWRDDIMLLFNRRDVPDLLASADIFLYATPPDSNDSLPRAVLEAQAAGLPAVVTATTGCPEIVEDGVTGLVVPYDAAAVAGGARRLLDDDALRRAMRQAARRRIAEHFTWDRMADGYAPVFSAVAAERRGWPATPHPTREERCA